MANLPEKIADMKDQHIRVSVVIPCYNHGLFVEEAVDSVLAQNYDPVEIIIINDGSDDPQTLDIIAHLNKEKTRVISIKNRGLAGARNRGIEEAKGDIILPLDADDKIDGNYLSNAVALLDEDPEIGIVYSHARLFGAVNASWLLPNYSLESMLLDNVIFCSALFRKADWKKAGGYDTELVYGWEDYDLWLSIIKSGKRVLQLPYEHFHYRVAADSMVRSLNKSQKVESFKKIYLKHQDLFRENIEIWLDRLVEVKEPYHTCKCYIDTGDGYTESQVLTRKIVPGTQILTFDISSFQNIVKFRLDPVDCPAVLSVHQIVLQGSGSDTEVSVNSLKGSHVCLDGNRYMFSDHDPKLHIQMVKHAAHASFTTLRCEIELHSFGNEALRKIVDYLASGQKQQRISGAIRKVGKIISGQK